jgi:uncharacterized protein (DUF58 family)
VKRFEEERELTVVVAMDLSGSLAFGSRARTKRDVAAEAGALIALAAARNRDRVGLLLFTDAVELYLPPGKSRARTLRIVREMLAYEPKGKGTDLASALSFLGRVLRRRAIVVLVSDWIASDFDRPLSYLSRRHEVVVVEVSDPLEHDLPPSGLLRARDLETGRVGWADLDSKRSRAEWRAAKARRARSLGEAFTRARAGRIALEVGSPVAPLLIRHFERRTHRGG